LAQLLRNYLLTLLDGYKPFDPKEERDVALIAELVRQYDNIVSRTCIAGHITGSALVMNSKTGNILLHYHKSLSRWLQFGGHMEEGETDPAQTALREAQEESGLLALRFWSGNQTHQPIDIDVHIIPLSSTMPEHPHLDFRYLLLTEESDIPQAGEDESNEFVWITPQEVAQYITDIALLRLIAKAELWWTGQSK
jgi:8-oxo-dGTP pyrophosphatase MutT (NUDIX family)